MSASILHLRHQGPVLAALARAARTAARSGGGGTPPATPGPTLSATVSPRDPVLVRDYVRHVGGNGAAWKGELPPHFFPQWGFPLFSRLLEDVPYDLRRVLNGGCRMTINGPIPADEPLHLEARLESIDDDGRRAVMHQRLVTSTASAPEVLVADMYAIVPLRKRAEGEPRKEPARVPEHLREVDRWKLPSGAGWDFALLTGDFNPVHWLAPAARLSGFPSCILHGFSTLARSFEGIGKRVLSGDVHRIRTLDVRFTRPLVLPAKVGLFVGDDGELAVGLAPGGPAFLTGTFTLREDRTP